jgi:hypothetical protein
LGKDEFGLDWHFDFRGVTPQDDEFHAGIEPA